MSKFKQPKQELDDFGSYFINPSAPTEDLLCPVCGIGEISQDTMVVLKDHPEANRKGWVRRIFPCRACSAVILDRMEKATAQRKEVNRQNSLSKLMVECGVPLIQSEAALQNCQPMDFPEPRRHGNSLYIHGPTGSGKTYLAAALLREDLRDKKEAEMITLIELLSMIRGSFKDSADMSELELVEKYTTIECLYIDDLGTEKITDWALSTLQLIMDKRWGNLMQTTFTSNLSMEELSAVYGERISSRIKGTCQLLKVPEIDLRSN